MDIYPSTGYTAVPTCINTDVCLPRQVANKTYRLRLRLPLDAIMHFMVSFIAYVMYRIRYFIMHESRYLVQID
jgi:type VI protein secretion system component VasF